jgi:DNA replication protein DnaC
MLREKYGERCYSRLIEMCNIVAITGEDLRLKRETQL